MLEYARWKYILVSIVLVLAFLFALPNVFGETRALQVARKDHNALDATAQQAIEKFLLDQKIAFDRSVLDSGRVMVHFAGAGHLRQDRHPADAIRAGPARRSVPAVSGGHERCHQPGAERVRAGHP